MTGRVWWITGGGSGIGRALARQVAAAGDRVAISGRRSETLEETAGSTQGIRTCRLDVTSGPDVDATIETIEANLGNIDIAVLNAALYLPMDVDDFDRDRFRGMLDVNVMGVANCLQPLLQRMSRRGKGHIVIVASVAGYRGLPKAAAYGATKAALINMAESLHPSAAAAGVAIQVVNPGFVETPMTAANRFPMPFLTNADDAAAVIRRGVEHPGRFEIAFPWPFVIMLKLARLLPARLYLAITRRMA